MASFRRTRRKKAQRKITGRSNHASLAAMAPVIAAKGIFESIHQQVRINQKTIDDRPTDKLVFVILSQLSGAQSISATDFQIRVDKPLLNAFGYSSCAEQSVIQRTLDAATEENVCQLKQVVRSLFAQYNLISSVFVQKHQVEPKFLTIDCDLSAQPASSESQCSTKGYFARRKNTYGRQLARVCVAETSEVVCDQLYPGNTTSSTVFKEMIGELEHQLNLTEKPTRRSIRLRLDGGFGTDSNINWALSRGYHLLTKVYSGNRARKLAQSVSQWKPAQTSHQAEKGLSATREAGWVTEPHRYCRNTRQLAIRTPNAKANCGYSYCVLVTTDLSSKMETVLRDYDFRSGIPESVFCQDNQGLAARKRRKKNFVAQQMLMLLTQLAHNLLLWIKQWTLDAIQFLRKAEDWVVSICKRLSIERSQAQMLFDKSVALLQEWGIKRLTHQLLALSGKLVVRNGQLCRLILIPGYPLLNRILVAFSALLADYPVEIRLGKT